MAELEAKGFKSHERERVINAMQGYWLIMMAANGSARSTKFETLAELDQAFNDLEEERSTASGLSAVTRARSPAAPRDRRVP